MTTVQNEKKHEQPVGRCKRTDSDVQRIDTR